MARALLLVYKWDTKRASDSFLNLGPQGIFKFDPNATIQNEGTCESCYEDFPLEDYLWTKIDDCGHTLCNDCYKNHCISLLAKGA